MADSEKITISVLRYNPEKDSAPHFQDFIVECGADWTILDVLNEIVKSHDASLSFRQSCRVGMCGSCAAIVNGRHSLLCKTFLKDLKKPIKIEPIKNFPIVRDLVVDIDSAMESLRDAMPYTERMIKSDEALRENPQSQKELEKISQGSRCIKCMLCYSACPVYGANKRFTGPAALVLASRYNADSRDRMKDEREDGIIGENGVWSCSQVGECSAACPKNVDPEMTIQRLKIMGSFGIIKKVFKKITNRKP